MMKCLSRAKSFCFLMLLPLAAATAQEATTEGQSGSFEDVSREASELLTSLESYGADQRDEALEASREVLDKVDAQIDAMAESMAKNWNDMDAAAREESREAMESLRKQRTELAEWYGGMKHSSAGAWDEMKAGFSGAWDSLSEAWGRAAAEFEESE